MVKHDLIGLDMADAVQEGPDVQGVLLDFTVY